MTFRAFISADIVPNDALASVLRELSGSRADLKTVRPEIMHVTLKFLGDTDEKIAEDVASRMREAVKDQPPMTIHLCGMGAFPSMSNIRVIWVGIEDGKPLGEIAKRLDASLSDLGFERDKKGFVAHLTVARTRSGRNIANVQEILRRNGATDYGFYLIDRIRLKKSVLSPAGPTYSTVTEAILETH